MGGQQVGIVRVDHGATLYSAFKLLMTDMTSENVIHSRCPSDKNCIIQLVIGDHILPHKTWRDVKLTEDIEVTIYFTIVATRIETLPPPLPLELNRFNNIDYHKQVFDASFQVHQGLHMINQF